MLKTLLKVCSVVPDVVRAAQNISGPTNVKHEIGLSSRGRVTSHGEDAAAAVKSESHTNVQQQVLEEVQHFSTPTTDLQIRILNA